MERAVEGGTHTQASISRSGVVGCVGEFGEFPVTTERRIDARSAIINH
jgi:hypothetical protein